MPQSALQKAEKDTVKDPVVLAHRFSESLGLKPPPYKLYTGTHFAEQAKYVSIRFAPEQLRKWGSLEFIHLTDMQWGHVCCKKEAYREFRSYILEKDGRFALLGGDCVDAWRLGSPGDPHENTGTPHSQVREFCTETSPFAHRIIGSVGGNHERRSAIGFGDLGSLISSILRVPYSSGHQFIDINVGDKRILTIDMHHGIGAAGTKGGRINMLYGFMLQSDADVVLVGHLHDAIQTYRMRRVRDSANLKPLFIRQGGGMSSSFLEWIGSYGEVGGKTAMDCMMSRITVTPNWKWKLDYTGE